LGFQVDDRHLKRAGLDYWQEVDTRHHMDFESFLQYKNENEGGALIGFSTHAQEDYTRAEVHRGDWLLFGRETFGLPAEIRETYSCYKVPIWGRVRSLNLATTVGIVVYHYLHELGRF
jgi:tRNA (cytidine/uridine-2'-O-)-methyltransferase